MKHLAILLFILCFSTVMNAQEGTKESTVGEFMRSNQRSYVVIAVLLTIFLGIILYLVRLERKIKRLEKENKQ